MSNLYSSPDPYFFALLYAVQAKKLDKVTAILDASTNPCELIKGENGNTLNRTMLTYAASINVDPEILHKMIDVCPAALGVRDSAGLTPLHWALFNEYEYDTILHMLVKDPTYPKVLEKNTVYPTAPTPLDFLSRNYTKYNVKDKERIRLLVDVTTSVPEIVRVMSERASKRREPAFLAWEAARRHRRRPPVGGEGRATAPRPRRRSRMSFTRKRRSLNKKK